MDSLMPLLKLHLHGILNCGWFGVLILSTLFLTFAHVLVSRLCVFLYIVKYSTVCTTLYVFYCWWALFSALGNICLFIFLRIYLGMEFLVNKIGIYIPLLELLIDFLTWFYTPTSKEWEFHLLPMLAATWNFSAFLAMLASKCYFPEESWGWLPFHCLVAHLGIFFYKLPVEICGPFFKIQLFVSFLLIYGSLQNIPDMNFLLDMHYKYSLPPGCGLLFLSCVFWCDLISYPLIYSLRPSLWPSCWSFHKLGVSWMPCSSLPSSHPRPPSISRYLDGLLLYSTWYLPRGPSLTTASKISFPTFLACLMFPHSIYNLLYILICLFVPFPTWH